MTGLWKKMAAGDLNWWPHACAAAAPPPRARIIFCLFWVSLLEANVYPSLFVTSTNAVLAGRMGSVRLCSRPS